MAGSLRDAEGGADNRNIKKRREGRRIYSSGDVKSNDGEVG